MAWETRRGNRYYYSATRCGDRVEKVYHGRGIVAELAAGLVTQAGRRRAGQAMALAADKSTLGPLDDAITALDRACRLMVEATLTAGGFHRPNYAWRRKRVRIDEVGDPARSPGRRRDPRPAGAGEGG